VLGAARYPFPATTDFSAFLLQAQSSRAKVLGFANASTDTVNCIKGGGNSACTAPCGSPPC
jgi:branched-chain amino acid transport system substrate-binding protein